MYNKKYQNILVTALTFNKLQYISFLDCKNISFDILSEPKTFI